MSPFLAIKKEIRDKSFLQRVSCAMASVVVLAFWVGMLMAAWRYPSEYDWRYMTVSDLVSADHNPAGYLWASVGIVLSSLCGLCWTTVLTLRRNHESAEDGPGGIRALRFGYISMIGAAVLPRRLLRVQKGHEILAILAFAGLCIGVVYLTFQTIERLLQGRVRRSNGHARLYAIIVAGVAVFPILLAGLAQAYVHFVLPELPWVNISWRARGVPVYLSFAFWEWVTCTMLSVYLMILSLATHSGYPARKTGEGT
jgi:hypothetical protein